MHDQHMDGARFWSVVGSSGPELTVGRLAMVLNSLAPNDLRAFCLWLDHIDDELNTRSHRDHSASAFELAATGITHSWAAPADPCPADFVELRATVVALGQDTWRTVAAGPALLVGGWPTGLGRAFLLAVAEAWQRCFPDCRPA